MKSLCPLLVVAIYMMVSTASAQGGFGDCCTKIKNTRVQRDLLVSYYKQSLASCSIRAVVFYTEKGKRICADPSNIWTKTSMAYLDGKNWAQDHNKTTSSHTTAPQPTATAQTLRSLKSMILERRH